MFNQEYWSAPVFILWKVWIKQHQCRQLEKSCIGSGLDKELEPHTNDQLRQQDAT